MSIQDSKSLKAEANRLGFDACGIARAGAIDAGGHLDGWLAQGRHAGMAWLARTQAQREDVSKKLPGARSVVVLAKNYYADRPAKNRHEGRVARYAWGRDYHNVLRKPLRKLARHIASLQPGVLVYASIDTGPVLERAWAARAGVGSIGKNSLALRRDFGSWFFLATILTTAEFEPDAPATDLCGTCTLCIEACPTGAIVEPYVVDSNQCISYHTIENRGKIPGDLHEAHGDWLFGCDVCQEVCPWNRFAQTTTEPDFLPKPGQANPAPASLLKMSQLEFDNTYEGTPLRRPKFAGMLRNARIVKQNLSRNSA